MSNLEQLDTTIKRVFDRELRRTVEAGPEYDDSGRWAENLASKVKDGIVDRVTEVLDAYIEPISGELSRLDTEQRGEYRRAFQKRAIQRLKQGKWDVQKKG